jgi:hypothetical protein
MPDDYLTRDQAAEKLMKASKRVKRRTVPSLLKPLATIADPDVEGQRLYLEADVDAVCDVLLRKSAW